MVQLPVQQQQNQPGTRHRQQQLNTTLPLVNIVYNQYFNNTTSNSPSTVTELNSNFSSLIDIRTPSIAHSLSASPTRQQQLNVPRSLSSSIPDNNNSNLATRKYFKENTASFKRSFSLDDKTSDGCKSGSWWKAALPVATLSGSTVFKSWFKTDQRGHQLLEEDDGGYSTLGGGTLEGANGSGGGADASLARQQSYAWPEIDSATGKPTIKWTPEQVEAQKHLLIRPDLPCVDMPKRYLLACMANLGFLVIFGIRCNLGVSIIKMISNRTINGVTYEPEFDWSPAITGLVESSFFYGYIVTQIPAGYLCARVPANQVFGVGIFVSSILNLILPGAARLHYTTAMVVKILQGLAEGVTYPACHGMWRYWAPPLERSKLATIAFCGSYAGAVMGLPLGGFLAQYVSWQAPFYFYGVVGIIWCFFWKYFSFEKPSIHPTITQTERVYIEEAIGEASTLQPGIRADPTKQFDNVPWGKILRSFPVWAIVVANFCRSWTFYLLLTDQPSYYEQVFGAKIAQAGSEGALPHLLMALIVPVGGTLADYLRRRYLSTTAVRKIFNCGGFGGEAIFLIFVAYASSEGESLLFLVIAVASSGFAISGFNVNHLDIAPRYASILMGFSNGIGTLSGMICPVVVQIMTQNHTAEEWRDVFIVAGVIHFIGVIFYAIFASGEKQPWADEGDNNTPAATALTGTTTLATYGSDGGGGGGNVAGEGGGTNRGNITWNTYGHKASVDSASYATSYGAASGGVGQAGGYNDWSSTAYNNNNNNNNNNSKPVQQQDATSGAYWPQENYSGDAAAAANTGSYNSGANASQLGNTTNLYGTAGSYNANYAAYGGSNTNSYQ